MSCYNHSLSSRVRENSARIAASCIAFMVAVILIFSFVMAPATSLASETKSEKKKTAAKKSDEKKKTDKKKSEKKSDKKKDPYAWKSLFDGKTLKNWKSAEFGGEGEVRAEKGSIFLDCGETLTAVVFKGKPPRMNYELSLEGRRLDGSDFFATTTFPIDKSYCSLVVGGWGGTVVGLSCVDFYDASDNITTKFVDLQTKKWYRVRIRVSKARIEAWIDDEQVVDLLTEGHKFDTRFEVDVCKPLGIASWCCSAELRNIRIRDLKPKEIAEAAKKREDEE